jgi:secreted PhoX family phosphatase
MTIDGRAAGHPRLQTDADPEGMTIIGTLNNCAGGMTPWGTYLMAEENFHGYFMTSNRDAEGKADLSTLPVREAERHKRYGVPGGLYAWGPMHYRFDITKEPNEPNRFGHIIEIKEDGGDHGAAPGTLSILVRCGDPAVAEVGAVWNPDTSENGWFGSPDNAATDAQGRLWVFIDQGRNWSKTGKSDGLYGVETEGAARGTSKLFFRCPVGGEMCGPYFTDDQETLFLAVQHPGTDGTNELAGFNRASTFEDPATRWPDFDPAMPPCPAVVVVVTKQGGGKIAV